MKELLRLFELPGALAFLLTVSPAAVNPPVIEAPEDLSPASFLDCPLDAGQEGRAYCAQILPDGSRLFLKADQEKLGNDVKRQVQTFELKPGGHALERETVRRKTVYASEKKIKTEFLDIVRNRQTHVTRDIVYYEYYPKTQRPKNILWSRYVQYKPGKLAKITRYLTLTYNPYGKLVQSQSHRWDYQNP